MRVIEGQLTAEGMKFGLLASRFNEIFVSKLVDGSVDCLKRHGTSEQDIELAWVPGSFEIPLAAKKMANSGKYDAIICLGAVIRGSTPHFDYVSSEVTKGIASVSLESEVPIMFGVLTTDNIDQAVERAGSKAGNKGWEAALGAIEMVSLIKKFQE